MRKCFFFLGCFFVILSLCSCSGLGGADKSAGKAAIIQSLREAEAKVGDVNQVFTADRTRFYSGQVIENAFGFGEATFYGELVEYNSLDCTILDYVESLETCNAMMHQNYPGKRYDASKKYVEFSSYTSTSTNEVVAFEVRIFWGNFMDTFASEGWYAKAVTFSPDLKIDIYANKNIETGEYAYYWGNVSFDNQGSSDFHTETVSEYPAAMEKLGTISKVYANFVSGEIEEVLFCDGSLKYTSYYGEYTSLDPKVIAYFNNQPANALNQNSYNVTEDSGKYYVEYIYYDYFDESLTDFHGVRFVSDLAKKKNFTGEWYAKCIDLNADQDIYDYICAHQN